MITAGRDRALPSCGISDGEWNVVSTKALSLSRLPLPLPPPKHHEILACVQFTRRALGSGSSTAFTHFFYVITFKWEKLIMKTRPDRL